MLCMQYVKNGCQTKKRCADRESNPGQMLGRHLCYHYTIGAVRYNYCYTACYTLAVGGSIYNHIILDNWQVGHFVTYVTYVTHVSHVINEPAKGSQ